MQNWAKRGLQTALVTGGLLMLGTGIASADEKDVNPDAPASPLDGSVTIPVDIGDNAIGTPGGQIDLPEHKAEYSSKQLTEPLKDALGGAATGAELPTSDAKSAATSSDDPFRGNKGSLDLVVPVQVANNALALFGPAEVSGKDHEQTYDGSSDVQTDGAGSSLGGNVVDIDWAAPIQIANNAGGIGGNASSTGNSATQETTQGGDVDTDGSEGVLAGNIIAPQGATPVQVNNNAAGGGGTFESSGNTSSSDTKTGGSPYSNGEDGVGSGNVAGVPVAFPVEVNNSALSGVGIADSSGNANTANATAGQARPYGNQTPRYIKTSGDRGVASGNVAQPQAAGDAAVHGVAGTLVGIANSGASDSRSGAGNTNETNSEAGGFSHTTGQESVLGGNLADAPVAAPVEAFCAAGSVAGTASASCANDTSADAGGGTYTNATDSVLGGNTATAPVATTVEAFGAALGGVGIADSTATEDKTVDAGGNNGSAGDGSTVGGNIVQAPVAAPIEAFGLGGGALGSGSASASETKVVNSGGDGNTEDDDATLASNVIAAPIAQPIQAFGIGGSAVGKGSGDATADTETEAGGTYTGSGEGGSGSGNIVQAASSAPAQLFGIGGGVGGEGHGSGENTSSSTAGGDNLTNGADGQLSGNVGAVANSLPLQVHGLAGAVVGEGTGTSDNVTDSSAGGDTDTDGTGSSLGGNVVQAPVGGAGSVFGSAAAVLGDAAGDGSNDVVSTSGGDTETAGDDGSLAGNVVSAQALPIAQVFGDGVSVFGFADGVGDSTTDATSGGDVTTSGDSGSLSGNIFDVPAAAVAQIFGDAIAIGGEASGTGDNTTVGSVGGLTETTDGFDAQLPVGVLAQVFNFSGPIVGQALGTGVNSTDIAVGDTIPQLDLILDGAEMPIDGLPSLDGLAVPMSGARSGHHPGVPGLPADLPVVSDLVDLQIGSGLPQQLLGNVPGGVPGGLPTGLPTGLPAGLPVGGAADVSPALMPKPLPSPTPRVDRPLPAPALPSAPADLPTLPVLPELAGLLDEVALPEAGALPPTTLPAPALPEPATTLPAPALPEVAQTLPAPALPEVAQTLPAPALPEPATTLPAPAAADLPEVGLPDTARTLPASGASVQEAGLRGLWAKFFGFVTNRPMHIEGIEG